MLPTTSAPALPALPFPSTLPAGVVWAATAPFEPPRGVHRLGKGSTGTVWHVGDAAFKLSHEAEVVGTTRLSDAWAAADLRAIPGLTALVPPVLAADPAGHWILTPRVPPAAFLHPFFRGIPQRATARAAAAPFAAIPSEALTQLRALLDIAAAHGCYYGDTLARHLAWVDSRWVLVDYGGWSTPTTRAHRGAWSWQAAFWIQRAPDSYAQHRYRGAFQQLVRALVTARLTATDDPVTVWDAISQMQSAPTTR